ncbi:MAG: DUF547 domain-containing protein [Gammaproteobacteria bacterium]
MSKFRQLFYSLLIILFLSNLSLVAKAGTDLNLWPHWLVCNPLSHETVDHAMWQNFLTKYVKSVNQYYNLVDYAHVSSQDKQNLEAYLKYLSHITISNYNRSEQLAYWLNLYNALVVKIILDNYPVESIQQIDLDSGITSFFQNGPWKSPLITIEGQRIALDDIEHRIIRPIWSDARTHYALVCAALTCPKLQISPYLGNRLNQQLNAAAHEYINSPQGVTVNNGSLVLSKIFSWFQIDFGNSEPAVIRHLMIYANPQLREKLKHFKKVTDYRYDWSLNSYPQKNLH